MIAKVGVNRVPLCERNCNAQCSCESLAAAITDAANWLAQQFSDAGDAELATQPKPEEKPALTLEQVRAVLADKSRAGHTAAIRDLLQKYGASKLSQVDPKNYEALLRDAEVLDHAT